MPTLSKTSPMASSRVSPRVETAPSSTAKRELWPPERTRPTKRAGGGSGAAGSPGAAEEGGVEVPFQVMDGVEGAAAGEGDRLADRQPDEQRAHQARTAGGGHHLDVAQADPGPLQRLARSPPASWPGARARRSRAPRRRRGGARRAGWRPPTRAPARRRRARRRRCRRRRSRCRGRGGGPCGGV